MEKKVGIPIRDVLQLDSLSGVYMLAGEKGMDREVTSVNVLEVPDIVDWVSPGELIITTAYPYKNNVSGLFELVEKLNAAKVSGLGIKSKRYIGEVPEEVIKRANELSFPIFEIPFSSAFSEIITQTLTAILNHQTFMLGQIHDLNRSLTQAMLSGGNLQEISQILYQRFGNSVAIISDYLSSFVCNTTDQKRDQICRIIESEKQEQLLRDESSPNAMSTYRVTDQLEGEACERIVIPICNEKILYGKIYVWEDFRELSGVEQSSIESSTSLIALDIIKKLSILEIENNNHAGFLDNLLAGERRQYQKAMLSAKLFDFDPQAAHQVILLRLRRSQSQKSIAKKVLYNLNTNVIAVLRSTVKKAASKIIYANRGNSVVLLYQAPDDNESLAEKKIKYFLDILCERLDIEKLEPYLAIGVGRSYANSNELYKSLQEARRASFSPQACGHRAVFYSEIGIYRLLTFDSIRAESELFCEEMLKPLLLYDEEKDADIMKTVCAYFKCKGNLTKLARELNVHYNTIIYRLQKIKTLLHIDLESEQDLLDLQIALKIYEMMEND